jgi:hypothetical protein
MSTVALPKSVPRFAHAGGQRSLMVQVLQEDIGLLVVAMDSELGNDQR